MLAAEKHIRFAGPRVRLSGSGAQAQGLMQLRQRIVSTRGARYQGQGHSGAGSQNPLGLLDEQPSGLSRHVQQQLQQLVLIEWRSTRSLNECAFIQLDLEKARSNQSMLC